MQSLNITKPASITYNTRYQQQTVKNSGLPTQAVRQASDSEESLNVTNLAAISFGKSFLNLEKSNTFKGAIRKLFQLGTGDGNVQTPKFIMNTKRGMFHGFSFKEVTSTEKVLKNTNGEVIGREIYEQAPGLRGKFNIFTEDAAGNRTQIGSAKRTRHGSIVLKKDLVSPSGTKTNYYHIQDNHGNRYLYSKTTDKNGNVLSTNSQRFNVLGENHFQSIENGETFDIRYFEDKVVVTRDNGAITEVPIGGNGINSSGVISRDLVPLTKQLPGSTYFDMTASRMKKISIDPDDIERNNAIYYNGTREIAVSKELSTPDSLYEFLHEFGHFRARIPADQLHENKAFVSAFKKERKAFYEVASKDEVRQLKHIISGSDDLQDHAAEPFAELHALMHVPYQDGTRALRSELVQKYFPESLAAVTELTKGSIARTKALWDDTLRHLAEENL